jgi:hypothetical protein
MQGVLFFCVYVDLGIICVCGIQKAIGLSPCKENQSREIVLGIVYLREYINPKVAN